MAGFEFGAFITGKSQHMVRINGIYYNAIQLYILIVKNKQIEAIFVRNERPKKERQADDSNGVLSVIVCKHRHFIRIARLVNR